MASAVGPPPGGCPAGIISTAIAGTAHRAARSRSKTTRAVIAAASAPRRAHASRRGRSGGGGPATAKRALPSPACLERGAREPRNLSPRRPFPSRPRPFENAIEREAKRENERHGLALRRCRGCGRHAPGRQLRRPCALDALRRPRARRGAAKGAARTHLPHPQTRNRLCGDGPSIRARRSCSDAACPAPLSARPSPPAPLSPLLARAHAFALAQGRGAPRRGGVRHARAETRWRVARSRLVSAGAWAVRPTRAVPSDRYRRPLSSAPPHRDA